MILRIWPYLTFLFACVQSQRLYSAKFSVTSPPEQSVNHRPSPTPNFISPDGLTPQESTPTTFVPFPESTANYQLRQFSQPSYEFLPPLFESNLYSKIDLLPERTLGQLSDQARQEQIEHRYELERIEKLAQIADQNNVRAQAHFPKVEQVPEKKPELIQEQRLQQKIEYPAGLPPRGRVDYFTPQKSVVTQPLFPSAHDPIFKQTQYQILPDKQEQSAELPKIFEQKVTSSVSNQAFYPEVQEQRTNQPQKQTELSDRSTANEREFEQRVNSSFQVANQRSLVNNLQQQTTISYSKPFKQIPNIDQTAKYELKQEQKSEPRIRNRIKQKPVKKLTQQYEESTQKTIQETTVQPTQEPIHVNYNFRYKVNDEVTGDIKNREESRVDDEVKGSYSIVEPDGRIRIVEYTANDIQGFIANVRYEEPAVKVTTSTQGPLKIRLLKGD